MATQASVEQKIDIGRVIQRGFQTIGRQALVFLGVAFLLVGLPTFLIQYVTLSRIGSGDISLVFSPFYWVGVIVSILTGVLLQAAIVRASIRDLRGESVLLGENLVEALKLTLPMIGLAILTWLAMMIGFLLLIVPGIIVYIMLIVAVPVLVEERPGIFASMARSRELTKGSRWHIFLLLILFFVVYMVLAGLFGLFSAPFLLSSPIVGGISQAALATVVGLLGAAMVASLYVELRVIKEGAGDANLSAIFA